MTILDLSDGVAWMANVPDYDCEKCRMKLVKEGRIWPFRSRMILCPICGNKRCPKASDHELDCTNSNELGQKGSVYG